MSQLTRNLIRPGIPASLSGPPVLSVVLRAMDPGCHKRNVPDLSRMSTHYHVPLTIHCHTNFSTTAWLTSLEWAHTLPLATHVTLPHMLHYCTIFPSTDAHIQLWNSSHLHMPHTLNIGMHVHIFFRCCYFWEKWTWQGHILRWNKLSGAHDGQCRHSRPAKASTPPPGGLRRIIAVEKYFNAVSLYI